MALASRELPTQAASASQPRAPRPHYGTRRRIDDRTPGPGRSHRCLTSHRYPLRAAPEFESPVVTLRGSEPDPDESLDPADWEAFKDLAHRLLDDVLDHLRAVPERPAWRPVPAAVRQALAEPLAGRRSRHRADLPRRARADPAVPHRQRAPALLGLGARLRHRVRRAGRAGRRRDQRQLRRARPRRHLRRAPGDRMVPPAVRLPRTTAAASWSAAHRWRR